MSEASKIEWTDGTWNFILGCKKCSSGCLGCYAVKDVLRMASNPNPKIANPNRVLAYRQRNGILNWTAVVRRLPERLAVPFDWATPKKVFVNSLSDLFFEDDPGSDPDYTVPLDFIRRAFDVMRATPWHTYQALTKRAERLAKLSPELDWPDNLWMGVSVENQKNASRIPHLRGYGAKVKFLSVEPLLGPVELDLGGIDWVITGGESGPHARRFDPTWALAVRDQCRRDGALFFHKQNGSFPVGSKKRQGKKATGRLLDGRTYDDMPAVKTVPVPQRKERMALAARLVPEAGDGGRFPLDLVGGDGS